MSIPTILSGAAGRALNTLRPLAKPGGRDRAITALVLTDRARPDMVKALGTDRAKALGKSIFEGARRSNTAAGREQVRTALDTLQEAAKQTATRRVIVGGLALGTGYAGYRLLGAGSDAGQPMAPGPFREPGAPDLPSTGTYAEYV